MFINNIKEYLLLNGLDEKYLEPLLFLFSFLILALIGFILNLILKLIVLNLAKKIIQKTKTTFDDLLLKHKIFHRISSLAMISLLKIINEGYFYSIKSIGNLNDIILNLIFVVTIIFILDSILNLTNDVWQKSNFSKKFPIKSFIQALKLIVYFFGVIFILSILLKKSPIYFISGLGALTAVLLLVFKDSILGLVAGIQVSANNSINVGDWIEIPSHSANGTVADLSLTTLKVENWDQTISSIPMHALISDSFKNWRNMSESNGRRIKRSIIIDANSITFLDENLIRDLKEIDILKSYINKKTDEIEEYFRKSKNETKLDRKLTNIGTFRAYALEYLKCNPSINSDMTLIVRQLEPKESGIPIEIWTYSNTTDWIKYENIQSDVFDHLYSILNKFKLKAYQKPNATDVNLLAQKM